MHKPSARSTLLAMPELPDIEAYLHALRPRVLGQPVAGLRLSNAFVQRSGARMA